MTTEWTHRGGVWVRETDSTALLNAQTPGSFLADFDYSLNPLAGCPFACPDCYVPSLASTRFRRERLPDGRETSSRAAWGSWIEVRIHSVDVLRRALERGYLDGKRLFLSPLADVYWPGERVYRLTRRLLELLAQQPRFEWLLISTRSDLVGRDLDVLQQLGARVEVGVSVPTDRDDVRAVLGRHNLPVERRLQALRRLEEHGIPTRVHVAPLQPHTPDFAARLADCAHWVWIDWHQYTPGFAPLLSANGWSASTPVQARRLADRIAQLVGPERVGLGQPAFAKRAITK
ncbi:MAG: radical SAM protein [Chloroflexi bacterium]|nr:radical SAM protein [Chloroflexota bacterium]